jgi:hypothetical protein
MTKTTTKKQPSAQVEPAQKASALKVANEAKRAQPDWLRRGSLSPPRETETPSAPERLRTSDRSQGPPWLLGQEVLEFRSRIALENFKRVMARRAIEQRARP